jgi:hypothetical protein
VPSKPSPPETLLRALAAEPRATGSPALRAARDRCAAELRSLGYHVRELPFEFSAFPGRLATPDAGLSVLLAVAIATHIGARGARWLPLVILGVALVGVGMLSRWLARRGVLTLPVMRATGVNLEAQVPGDAPSVWLCAHLDSKSQPVPTLVRTAGVMVLSAGVLFALGLAIGAALERSAPFVVWVAAALLTLLGSLPVVLSVVTNRSPGALDNASGVATVIAAAQQLQDVRGVGVLITDAEELGLAGARAWRHDGDAVTVLNCDGVDDAGPVNVLYTGARPRRVLAAAAAASRQTGVPHLARRIPLGILMDSVAFTDAGMESVSFSRGTWRSLARVHSASDDLQHLAGAGIAGTATLMAETARKLLRDGAMTPNDGARR